MSHHLGRFFQCPKCCCSPKPCLYKPDALDAFRADFEKYKAQTKLANHVTNVQVHMFFLGYLGSHSIEYWQYQKAADHPYLNSFLKEFRKSLH